MATTTGNIGERTLSTGSLRRDGEGDDEGNNDDGEELAHGRAVG